MPWPLSVKQAAKSHLLSENAESSRAYIKPAALWMIECEIRRRCWWIRSLWTADVFLVVALAGETRNWSRKNRMLSQDNKFKDINIHTFAQGVRAMRNARARNLRMIVANWSVNSFDSRIKTWQEWRKRVVKEILTGSISHFSHRHRPLSQVTRFLFSLCLF